MPAPARQIDHDQPDDSAEVILDVYAGNALSALLSIIADVDVLCDRLETASLQLSSGVARTGNRSCGMNSEVQRLDCESRP
ncbi:hypothetical protein ASG19_02535 [Rhizobium sp. Leaf306]|nr:hypothetical protein ASG19_02535 [Rhizobium sp. Leaf306]